MYLRIGRVMRKINKTRSVLGALCEPPPLQTEEFKESWDTGGLVLDCRSPKAFGGGHIPDALNVGLTSSFPMLAGTVLPLERPYFLVREHADELWTAC